MIKKFNEWRQRYKAEVSKRKKEEEAWKQYRGELMKFLGDWNRIRREQIEAMKAGDQRLVDRLQNHLDTIYCPHCYRGEKKAYIHLVE